MFMLSSLNIGLLCCMIDSSAGQQDVDLPGLDDHVRLDPPNTKEIYQDILQSPSLPGDPRSSNWYLLELNGNVSQVFNRYSDFLVYLRLNIASQTGSEFDRVKLNRLSFSPSLLVNVTLLDPAANITVLRSIAAEHEALLQFSGEQFQLISVTSHDELLHPKKFQVFPSSLSDNFVLIVIIAIILLFLCIFICVCVIITINTKRRKVQARDRDTRPIFYSKLEPGDRGQGMLDTTASSPQDSCKLYPTDFDIVSQSVYLDDVDIKPGKTTNLNTHSLAALEAIQGGNVYSSTPKLRPRPRGPKPPPPPRFDSLAKNPTTGRPLSVPAPCHLSILPLDYPVSNIHQQQSEHLLTNAVPNVRPTSSAASYNLYTNVSQDEIESDVSFVLSTLQENI